MYLTPGDKWGDKGELEAEETAEEEEMESATSNFRSLVSARLGTSKLTS